MTTPHEDFLREAAERTFEKLTDSQCFVALFSEAYQRDPVALLQLGMAVVLDKPILLLVKQGVHIPENVRRLARAIEEYNTPDDAALATERLIKRIHP